MTKQKKGRKIRAVIEILRSLLLVSTRNFLLEKVEEELDNRMDKTTGKLAREPGKTRKIIVRKLQTRAQSRQNRRDQNFSFKRDKPIRPELEEVADPKSAINRGIKSQLDSQKNNKLMIEPMDASFINLRLDDIEKDTNLSQRFKLLRTKTLGGPFNIFNKTTPSLNKKNLEKSNGLC